MCSFAQSKAKLELAALKPASSPPLSTSSSTLKAPSQSNATTTTTTATASAAIATKENLDNDQPPFALEPSSGTGPRGAWGVTSDASAEPPNAVLAANTPMDPTNQAGSSEVEQAARVEEVPITAGREGGRGAGKGETLPKAAKLVQPAL